MVQTRVFEIGNVTFDLICFFRKLVVHRSHLISFVKLGNWDIKLCKVIHRISNESVENPDLFIELFLNRLNIWAILYKLLGFLHTQAGYISNDYFFKLSDFDSFVMISVHGLTSCFQIVTIKINSFVESL